MTVDDLSPVGREATEARAYELNRREAQAASTDDRFVEGRLAARDFYTAEPSKIETWMVDYEHSDDEPQHAVLSWIDDEATELPEVGTQLVRKADYDKLLTGPASYAGVTRMLGEVQRERDDYAARALRAEQTIAAEPSEDAVERAARALIEREADQMEQDTDGIATLDRWDECDEPTREVYRDEVRFVLAVLP